MYVTYLQTWDPQVQENPRIPNISTYLKRLSMGRGALKPVHHLPDSVEGTVIRSPGFLLGPCWDNSTCFLCRHFSGRQRPWATTALARVFTFTAGLPKVFLKGRLLWQCSYRAGCSFREGYTNPYKFHKMSLGAVPASM